MSAIVPALSLCKRWVFCVWSCGNGGHTVHCVIYIILACQWSGLSVCVCMPSGLHIGRLSGCVPTTSFTTTPTTPGREQETNSNSPGGSRRQTGGRLQETWAKEISGWWSWPFAAFRALRGRPAEDRGEVTGGGRTGDPSQWHGVCRPWRQRQGQDGHHGDRPKGPGDFRQRGYKWWSSFQGNLVLNFVLLCVRQVGVCLWNKDLYPWLCLVPLKYFVEI